MTGPTAVNSDVARPRSALTETVRSMASLVFALVCFAICLRLLDELPAAAAGIARGVRRVASIEALAAETGLKLPVPAYFPDTIQWPPSDVISYGGTSASAWYRHRGERTTWLIVAVAAGAGGVAPQVLPTAQVLQSEPITVGTHAGVAERIQDADGAVWHQVSWSTNGGARLVRYRGTLEELMTLAGSLSERGR